RLYAWEVVVRRYQALFAEMLAQAAGAPREPARRHVPGTYPHRDVFAHYATHVEPLPECVEWSADRGVLQAVRSLLGTEVVVEASAPRGPVPTAALASRLAAVCGPERAARTLGLLLKYGALHPARGAGRDAETT
ncbi:MAG TPA: hypothetical protein VJT67_04965, partial [Longimicrobiaceae bacterium]|nr:hypothetical protein [Longimicrobiaceae bacterium]